MKEIVMTTTETVQEDMQLELFKHPKEAQDIVVRWLRGGGKPNDELPYEYKYEYVSAWRGCACAGAAIGQLVYGKPVDAEDVGKDLYGDSETFFGLSDKGFYHSDTTEVAEYVSRLKPVSE
jgi:hypothetical protein